MAPVKWNSERMERLLKAVLHSQEKITCNYQKIATSWAELFPNDDQPSQESLKKILRKLKAPGGGDASTTSTPTGKATSASKGSGTERGHAGSSSAKKTPTSGKNRGAKRAAFRSDEGSLRDGESDDDDDDDDDELDATVRIKRETPSRSVIMKGTYAENDDEDEEMKPKPSKKQKTGHLASSASIRDSSTAGGTQNGAHMRRAISLDSDSDGGSYHPEI